VYFDIIHSLFIGFCFYNSQRASNAHAFNVVVHFEKYIVLKKLKDIPSPRSAID
jgi:hypothetical protein